MDVKITLFQRAISTLRKEGFFSLVKKSFLICFYSFKDFLSVLSLFLFKKRVIKEIVQFNNASLEDMTRFIFKAFFGAFAPMQVPSEFISLLNIFASQKPSVIVEIGTAKGGTLFCFSKLAPQESLIISIDLPNGLFGGGYPEWKTPIYRAFAQKEDLLHLLREDSHSEASLQKVKTILGDRKIDFLFIDGDHSYEGVKKDFEMYGPLVAKGGVVAFHDVAPEGTSEYVGGVPRFWNEIKTTRTYNEYIANIHQSSCGIGILFVE